MILAVVGSRNWTDKQKVMDELNNLSYSISQIVSGGAEGVDTLAATWARANHVPLVEYLPEWSQYGKAAGAIRNKLIVNSCDKLIAFWDGTSKGTKISIDLATQQGKLLSIFRITDLRAIRESRRRA